MEPRIKTYLTAIHSLLSSPTQKHYYKWLLDNLEYFTIRDTKTEDRLLSTAPFTIEPQQCFYNSQLLSVIKGYSYYEGWYLTDLLPVPLEHGFLVSNDKVIDVTSRLLEKKNIAKPGAVEYAGIHIPRDFIASYVLNHKKTSNLLYLYYCKEVMKGAD